MAVAYVSGSGLSSSNGVAVGRPSGPVAGNLFVCVVCYSTANTNGATLTGPGGWTMVGNSGQVSTCGGMAVFTKTVTGSEPTSYAFGPSGFMSATVNQFSGTGGLDGAPVFSNGTATPAVMPSITPTGSTDMYMGGAATQASTNLSVPSTLTVGGLTGASANGSASTWHLLLSSTSPTGTFSSTFTTSFWTSVSLLLAPGAGTITGTVTAALGPITTTATGTASGGTVTGTASLLLGPITTTTTGIVGLTGTSSLPLGPLTVTSTGTVLGTLTGTASVALGPLTLTATSIALAGAQIPLGPLTLTALSSLPPAPHYVTTIRTSDQ